MTQLLYAVWRSNEAQTAGGDPGMLCVSDFLPKSFMGRSEVWLLG
jgi:hypothetical protein